MSDEDERRIVKVEVVKEWSDEEWTVDEFIGLLNSIPAEFKDAAKVVFNGDYDSSSFEVSYERPETDEELADRAKRYAVYEAERLRRERAQFEALKKKFG